MPREASYLAPYVQSTREHRAGFKSLLWASPASQRTRFEAIARLVDFNGTSLVDAGCGRADLLSYLTDRNVIPLRYIGIEAVPELAAEARKVAEEVVEADFVENPAVLDRDADYVIFCGSLNTMRPVTFMMMIGHAFRFARTGVIFNFLAHAGLAAAPHLTWHRPADVLNFARTLSPRVTMIDDYLAGDATILIQRGNAPR